MTAGIASLIAAYVLSQFYRAFLAVLSPLLAADTGMTPEDMAEASGLWFVAFALMQLPIGWGLDRIGPRRTAAVLLAVGAGGAALFAAATGAGQIKLAMVLIGIGCAPVLMAAYYIFARSFSPAVFATLAGAAIGIGSIGNLASALPLAWAAETFGWRETVWAVAGLTLVVAGAIALLVRDPAPAPAGGEGSVFSLLAMPALWPVLAMMAVCYGPAAGLRGLWIGSYYADVFGADAAAIGQATLVMGLAMVAGNFAYGPLDRILGTRKGVVMGGNLLTLGCLGGLWLWPAAGGGLTLALLAGVGFFGASFPMMMAHGRAFFPPHLMGRGVTLLNLFGIGAAGLMQLASGRIHAAIAPAPVTAPYAALLAFFAVTLALGCVAYVFSRDRTD